jgi:parallel beta helix pectate lyase-like protein
LAPASAAAVSIAACALLLAAAPAALPAQRGCDQYASNSGTDGSSGRSDAPVRSIGRLLAGLSKGEVGCLMPGWRFSEHVRVDGVGGLGRPIRIRGLGTPRPVLSGILRVTKTGHDVTFQHLRIEGDGTPAKAIVSIAGTHISLVDDAITGTRYRNASVACIRVGGGARWTAIRRSRIHDCTRANTRMLYAPGIVVSDAQRTTIVDTIVYHTIGDAIVLAPNANGTRITHSILDSNTSGVYIGGSSSGNVVADNVIAFNGKWNVHGGGGSARGNVVTRNCLWKGFAANVAGRGFAAYGNLFHSPRYVQHGSTFRMRPGPCAGKRPGARGSAVPVATPPPRAAPPPVRRPASPRLARFLVQYRLLGLSRRVQVIALTFSRLKAGAAVDVRCVRGCNARERLTAGPDGTASSGALIGGWLQRGAVVAVREHRAGWVAAWARITVLGSPRGVRITHGAG